MSFSRSTLHNENIPPTSSSVMKATSTPSNETPMASTNQALDAAAATRQPSLWQPPVSGRLHVEKPASNSPFNPHGRPGPSQIPHSVHPTTTSKPSRPFYEPHLEPQDARSSSEHVLSIRPKDVSDMYNPISPSETLTDPKQSISIGKAGSGR